MERELRLAAEAAAAARMEDEGCCAKLCLWLGCSRPNADGSALLFHHVTRELLPSGNMQRPTVPFFAFCLAAPQVGVKEGIKSYVQGSSTANPRTVWEQFVPREGRLPATPTLTELQRSTTPSGEQLHDVAGAEASFESEADDDHGEFGAFFLV